MNMRDLCGLEVLSRYPGTGERFAHPLLFVHGAYAGAWCWDEHFLPHFAARGFECHALSLAGHGGSPDRACLDSYSVDDYVANLAAVIERLPAPPVLIGHSMGGLLVQKYLEQAALPGAVMLSPVPPQGLLGSAFGLALRKPALLADLNRLMSGGRADIDNLRAALFHRPIDEADLRRFLRASQPESHRAIWDMTLFNLPNLLRVARVPMLVVGASHDQLIPPQFVYATALSYGVRAHIVEGMGHAMMLEQGWQEVAGIVEDWLRTRLA